MQDNLQLWGMKELKDYIHLYIGCPVSILCDMPDGKYFLSGVTTKQIPGESLTRVQVWCEQRRQIYWLDIDVISLILRPLAESFMTQQEISSWNQWKQRKGWMPGVHAEKTLWLLSNGFDVFGLGEEGLAIYE